MKYSQSEAWAETKSFYSYKGRVPEATKSDLQKYTTVKNNGVTGTIRVPAKPIDTSALTIDAAHIASRGHNVSLDEAIGYIDNAIYSVRRNMSTNYYSPEGATYVGHDGMIKTAFKCEEYTGKVKKIMEELGYGK